MVRADKFIDEKGKKTIKQFTLYLEAKMYKELRVLAAYKEVSMNELGREGLEYILKKYKIK